MSDEQNSAPESPEPTQGEGKPGCMTAWIGLLIAFAPAILGPMQVSAECGSYANSSNCAAYMWPLMLTISLPIGFIVFFAGLAKSRKTPPQE